MPQDIDPGNQDVARDCKTCAHLYTAEGKICKSCIQVESVGFKNWKAQSAQAGLSHPLPQNSCTCPAGPSRNHPNLPSHSPVARACSTCANATGPATSDGPCMTCMVVCEDPPKFTNWKAQALTRPSPVEGRLLFSGQLSISRRHFEELFPGADLSSSFSLEVTTPEGVRTFTSLRPLCATADEVTFEVPTQPLPKTAQLAAEKPIHDYAADAAALWDELACNKQLTSRAHFTLRLAQALRAAHARGAKNG